MNYLDYEKLEEAIYTYNELKQELKRILPRWQIASDIRDIYVKDGGYRICFYDGGSYDVPFRWLQLSDEG